MQCRCSPGPTGNSCSSNLVSDFIALHALPMVYHLPSNLNKTFESVLTHLHEQYNITVTAYLDDLLLVADSPEQLIAVDIIIDLLMSSKILACQFKKYNSYGFA